MTAADGPARTSMSSPRGGSLSRPAVFLAAQAALLVGAAWLLLARDCGTPALPRRLLPWAASGGGGGNASGGSSGTRGSSGNASGSGSSLPAPAAELFQHTSALQEWVAAPDRLSFLAPQSRCLLDPRGECSCCLLLLQASCLHTANPSCFFHLHHPSAAQARWRRSGGGRWAPRPFCLTRPACPA